MRARGRYEGTKPLRLAKRESEVLRKIHFMRAGGDSFQALSRPLIWRAATTDFPHSANFRQNINRGLCYDSIEGLRLLLPRP